MFLLEKEITCFGNFAKFVVFIRSSFLVLCIYSFSWLRAVKYNIKDRCNTHCILEIFIQWSINFELLSILYIPVHSKENIFKVGIKKLTFLKYSTIASDVVSLWSIFGLFLCYSSITAKAYFTLIKKNNRSTYCLFGLRIHELYIYRVIFWKVFSLKDFAPL